MKLEFRLSLVWVAAVALALIVAACGPVPVDTVAEAEPDSIVDDGGAQATTDEDNAAPRDAAADDAPAAADTTAADNNDAAADRGATSGEVDAKGLPVGFTAEGRPYRGDLDAPVRIEEFSDYQCPFCGRFVQETLPAIEENQIASGEAVLIFYDFPLSFHEQAEEAAAAARCAGESGAAAYWEMHDRLFEGLATEEWSIADPTPIFVGYAAEQGLDATSFESCVTSGKYDDAIQADLLLGQQRGVTGTPAFFINNQLVSGAQPLAVFNTAIDRAARGEPIVDAPAEPAGTVDPSEIEVTVPDPTQFDDNVAFAMGENDAPVTIIEFTDYQCPFCARHSADTFGTIKSEMVDTGRVRYLIKDLPLENIHPEARIAAIAARCAGDQGEYLAMHNALFQQQSVWSGGGEEAAIAVFADIAASLALDEAAFNSCVENRTYDADVTANVEEAISVGVSGTPFFFVDGYPVINGAQPFQAFDIVVGFAENDQLVAEIEKVLQRQAAQQQQQQAQQQPPVADEPVEVDAGDAYAVGADDAPVEIIEYTDYQCPFCARHHSQTLPSILSEYVDAGLVRYVFKDFPLTSIHSEAIPAAEAARCAGDQDRFLDMHNLLFERQQAWSGAADTDTLFTGYAVELGLDEATFTACLDSDSKLDLIQADLDEGLSLGVRGTPAFFINGRFVNGAQPFPVFQQVIDAAIADSN